jgi:glutamine amidotransferase PdxT
LHKTVKIHEDLFREGIKIGNKSSTQVYLTAHERNHPPSKIQVVNVDDDRSEAGRQFSSFSNPFDVNLIDLHGKTSWE